MGAGSVVAGMGVGRGVSRKNKGGHIVKANNICCDFFCLTVKFAVKAPKRGTMATLFPYILISLAVGAT